MNLSRRVERSVFASLCVVSFLCFASCSQKPNAAPAAAKRGDGTVPVDVAPVEVLGLDRTLPIVGTLFAKDEATVAAEVEGKLEKTLVDFGDRIKAGQEIASIDTASYERLAAQAAANVARWQATTANAENELKRQKELGGIASKSDLDKSLAEFDQARAELKAAEAAEEMAKLNLTRSHVRAPFDAAVAERIGSAGDFVKVGAPLFRVVNDAVLKYIVQAPERYAAQVVKEQLVTFTVDAYPTLTFTGRVYLISPQVSTVTRAFSLGALVPNADRKLRASTFARGQLIIERNVPTPVVPLDAVVSFVGISKVFVVQNGVAKAREVEVGRVFDGKQEILAGVKPGEIIVVTGQTKLYDGAKVRVKEARPVQRSGNT